MREAHGGTAKSAGGGYGERKDKQGEESSSTRPTATDTLGKDKREWRAGGAEEEVHVERKGGVELAERTAVEGEGGDGREWDDGEIEADTDDMGSSKTVRGTGSVSVNMNVNRPKRCSRGQPLYDQTTRRKTALGARGRAEGRIRYVGEGASRRRVPLVQSIVVGRVCVMRMMRKGKDRTDAGRPHPDPG